MSRRILAGSARIDSRSRQGRSGRLFDQRFPANGTENTPGGGRTENNQPPRRARPGPPIARISRSTAGRSWPASRRTARPRGPVIIAVQSQSQRRREVRPVKRNRLAPLVFARRTSVQNSSTPQRFAMDRRSGSLAAGARAWKPSMFCVSNAGAVRTCVCHPHTGVWPGLSARGRRGNEPRLEEKKTKKKKKDLVDVAPAQPGRASIICCPTALPSSIRNTVGGVAGKRRAHPMPDNCRSALSPSRPEKCRRR